MNLKVSPGLTWRARFHPRCGGENDPVPGDLPVAAIGDRGWYRNDYSTPLTYRAAGGSRGASHLRDFTLGYSPVALFALGEFKAAHDALDGIFEFH